MEFISPNHNQVPKVQSTYLEFRTRALNLVRRSCGADSDHYRRLDRIADAPPGDDRPRSFYDCMGIVKAAQHDFESGLLFDVRALVAAEILGDFIDQAQTLLDAGYHVPAASLAGAVLEDSLRKLCGRQGIRIPEDTKIDKLNRLLAKAGAYNKLTQKQITAHEELRNNADHGHSDRFTNDDVSQLVKWMRRFAKEYLQ